MPDALDAIEPARVDEPAVLEVRVNHGSMERQGPATTPLEAGLDGEGRLLAYAKPELALKPASAIAPELDAALIKRLAEQGGRADLEAEIYRLQERERSCGGYSS